MGNNIVRMPPQQRALTPQQQFAAPDQQSWAWDGSSWVCPEPCPPSGGGQFPFCPPPGFPPPGCPPWFSGANSPPWYPGANAGVSFGATPPPNPVRGHFWWDGTGLAIFDGAVWVNTTNGAIIPPGSAIGPGSGGAGGTVVISSTAPGNPVPGMQWWDGSQLRVWDGTQWNVIGPGAIAGPVPTTTLSFAVTQAGYTSGIGTGWTIVPFTSTPQVDISSGWVAATKQFTPKKAGTYLFEAVGWEDTSGGIAIVKNDPGTLPSLQNSITVAVTLLATSGWMQALGISVMNGTTDFVRLWAQSGSGQIYGNLAPPMFSATLLP
jgi:hypothetical protein